VADKGEVQEGRELIQEEQGTGPDEFRAECLQSMDDLTVNYFIKLYGASIALEYVPAKWREITVIFIPKPGKSDYTDKRAFRPISLMSVLFKTLERLVNIIKKGLNQGEYVLGVFCDISGAFDNVLHSSITSAMSRRGIDSRIIKWYDHFLKTRTVTSTLVKNH
jgi:hypothetical protein